MLFTRLLTQKSPSEIFFKMASQRCRNYHTKKIVCNGCGDPLKVLSLEEESLPQVGKDEVVVKLLVASINPADINMIQGVYPIKFDSFPAVPGLEGVGEIVEVGSNVTTLKVGDRIIPNTEAFGSWRTYGIFNSKSVYKVASDVCIIGMAGICSNPFAAYRMLQDFVPLQPGDVVIQNGANSACGQNVIQMCRRKNIKSVNIVRDRPDIDKLKSYLQSLGADYVLTEEQLRSTQIFKSKECARPKLALNCVGGRNATDVSRQLSDGGVMVTYGGMSREPVTIATSAFIFKDLRFQGYWNGRWLAKNRNTDQCRQMIDDITAYLRSGELVAPIHRLVKIEDFREAITKTGGVQGFAGCKHLFDFREE